MLAKLTTKNQLTLPKAATQAVGASEYFEVETRAGQIILTPVRLQRADAVRAKLAELDLSEGDVADAVAWARSGALASDPRRVAEPVTGYAVKPVMKPSTKPALKAARKAATKTVSRK